MIKSDSNGSYKKFYKKKKKEISQFGKNIKQHCFNNNYNNNKCLLNSKTAYYYDFSHKMTKVMAAENLTTKEYI